MGETIYVLYKMSASLQCPIILGVFPESGETLERLEEHLFDYCRELGNITSYDEAEAYANRVADGLSEDGEYYDETFCEHFYLVLSTLGKIDLSPFIR